MRLFLLLFLVTTAIAETDPLPDETITNEEIDILTWNETTPAGMQASALRNTQKKWPKAIVPFIFHDSVKLQGRDIIEKAMEEIHEKTCVRFRKALAHNEDHVLIFRPLTRSCNSFVGRQGGKQQLNLGPGCYHRGIILHELMHALGFIHEHNRADRDEYVSINRNKIKRGQEQNFEKKNATDLTLMDTPYSYNSVMHYAEDLASIDGSPTIVPKINVKLGGGDHLSPIDVKRINRYYDCGTNFNKKKEDNNPFKKQFMEASFEVPDWMKSSRNKEFFNEAEKFHKDFQNQVQWSSWGR